MEGILSIVAVFLGLTCWVWPYLFVKSLLECIKLTIHNSADEKNEKFRRNRTIAVVSLLCMSLPAIIGCFLTFYGA